MCYNILSAKSKIHDWSCPMQNFKVIHKIWIPPFVSFEQECSAVYPISNKQGRECFHSDNTLHHMKYADGCVMLCFVVMLSGREIDMIYVSIFFRMAPWILDCWRINGVVQKINTKTWKWHFVFVQAIVTISFNKLRFGLLHLYMYLCVYIYILTYVEQHIAVYDKLYFPSNDT